MTIDIDLNEIQEFVESGKFSDFLLNNTTDFSVAAFILQTLLEKIDDLRQWEKDQEIKNRNVDKSGEWEINPDGYYPYCPFCGHEPPQRGIYYQCPNCGAQLSYRNLKWTFTMEEK